MRKQAWLRGVLTAVVLIVHLPICQAQDSQSKGQPSAATQGSQDITLDKIRHWIRSLEADQIAERDEAEAELVKLGPSIIKYLPSITPQTSGELKVRLQRIRNELDQTVEQTFFEASKVTLQGTMRLDEAFEKIKEQTGNAVEIQGGEGLGQIEVKTAWEDVDFWVAIDDLIQQTRLRLVAYGTTENRLVLASGYIDSGLKPFVTGPFRLDASGAVSEHVFGSELGGFTRVSLLFSWEPRLEPVFMQIPMSSVKATTEDGEQVFASQPQASPEIQLNVGGSSAQVDLQLQRVARKHSKLATIKGQFILSVPGERHQYEFKKLASGKRQLEKFGDVSVTLEGANRNGRVYEMRLFVEFGDSQGALDSFRGWILSNRAYILDADNNKLDNVGFQTYGAGDNGVGVSYMFQLNKDPDSYKLIYESPSTIRKQTIEYELSDIPLP